MDIKSSVIRELTYNPLNKTLTIVFHPTSKGIVKTYEYHKVPADVVDAVLSSKSVGSSFWQAIRKGKYKAEKVREEHIKDKA